MTTVVTTTLTDDSPKCGRCGIAKSRCAVVASVLVAAPPTTAADSWLDTSVTCCTRNLPACLLWVMARLPVRIRKWDMAGSVGPCFDELVPLGGTIESFASEELEELPRDLQARMVRWCNPTAPNHLSRGLLALSCPICGYELEDEPEFV